MHLENEEENEGEILPPRNPGSDGHPDRCKPCNKYNPSRPLGSCKHGNSCEFCHQPHERPKHRGQRGRHALQRRQYLEAKDGFPQEFRDLIDEIYRVPHSVVDDIKTKLGRYSHAEREEKVVVLLDEIRNIGERAQHARPDNTRLRGARINAEGASNVSELDGRCKWLVGTFHLMVRKMWDAQEPYAEIREKLDSLLQDCRALHQILENRGYTQPGSPLGPPPPLTAEVYGGVPRPAPPQSATQPSSLAEAPRVSDLKQGAEYEGIGVENGQYDWLIDRVKKLKERAEEDEDPPEEVEKVMASIRHALDRLPQSSFTEEFRNQLSRKSRSLWDLDGKLQNELDAVQKILGLDEPDDAEADD
mmetsp:Transcript_54604/g.152379  ORF Transcript_54604/g.152379 Transcript_54604/m.152379 type:complete len:361 (+) Transcript_54604:221-1303(+)